MKSELLPVDHQQGLLQELFPYNEEKIKAATLEKIVALMPGLLSKETVTAVMGDSSATCCGITYSGPGNEC